MPVAPSPAPGLAEYAAAVASGEPTPGGGSVVAVVAALGAALGEMVGNLTFGRPADAAVEAELWGAVERLRTLRDGLLAAAPADEAAFRGYVAAAALPNGTEPERATRRDALQAALLGAADVPLAVARNAVEVATLLEPVARLGNRHALADAVVGVLLTEAARRGALLNVRGNARRLRDADAADRYRRRAEEVETAGQAAVARVLAAADARDIGGEEGGRTRSG